MSPPMSQHLALRGLCHQYLNTIHLNSQLPLAERYGYKCITEYEYAVGLSTIGTKEYQPLNGFIYLMNTNLAVIMYTNTNLSMVTYA